MITFTMPPPATPSTSMFAISACAFCTLACIACACFIRLPILPFMGSRLLFQWPHRAGMERGAEAPAQRAGTGVGVERATRGFALFLRRALTRLRGRLGARRDDGVELEPDRLAEMA